MEIPPANEAVGNGDTKFCTWENADAIRDAVLVLVLVKIAISKQTITDMYGTKGPLLQIDPISVCHHGTKL
jgi:hypothetical protein